jgi:hypothetical protein
MGPDSGNAATFKNGHEIGVRRSQMGEDLSVSGTRTEQTIDELDEPIFRTGEFVHRYCGVDARAV